MIKRAFLFPGQGSQYVGMAKDFFENSSEAKEIILSSDDFLKIKLSEIMFDGPEEKLKQTEFTQSAIFLHSIVILQLLKKFECNGSAGHSLGEYSALVSAGAINFKDALKLVRLRGIEMQNDGLQNDGTMAAIVGLSNSFVEEACVEADKYGIVQCANFNSPGQIVISGSVNGVKKAMELCKQKGAKIVKELVVSGAFHSPLMQPAKDKMKIELEKALLINPKFPVYANVTANPVFNSNEIKNLLYEQITSPVRWEETILNMIKDGFNEFVEIGPGKVLQGLVKRINSDVKCFGIDKYSDVEKIL